MNAILELDQLEVRYRTGFGVGPVHGTFGPGLYWLAGRNGSGKTTLLRAMAGELRPKGGSCRVRGLDVYRDHRARGQIAYVAASPDFPDFMTVDEAWRLMASMRGNPRWDGETLRNTLGLDGGLLLSHASAGQRRQAELLAALAGDPDVLLLDEVFTHLDVQASAVLRNWVETWRQTRVVWLIGHHTPQLQPDAHYTIRPGESLVLQSV